MSACEILDTFPTFLSFWEGVRHISVEEQVEAWARDYMARWPELLRKQRNSYARENLDWRKVARERVFASMEQRLTAMCVAHDGLCDCCEPVCQKAQVALQWEHDLLCVFYVGIGCGAGWATSLGSSSAVLFGVEMIADCGWTHPPALSGLVAHEIGHIAHYLWRTEGDKKVAASSPWWQVYTEGFAQLCEHLILGEETWHESVGLNSFGWLDWCQQNRARLASGFLTMVASGASVRPYFGSWYDIEGWKQCGYFLGHEIVGHLQQYMSLREIALLDLDDIERRCRHTLEGFADEG